MPNPFGWIRCSRCRLPLPASEFYRSPSSGRRDRVCMLCKHQRLAAHHEKEAKLIRARRQRQRDEEKARMEASRAVLGKD